MGKGRKYSILIIHLIGFTSKKNFLEKFINMIIISNWKIDVYFGDTLS